MLVEQGPQDLPLEQEAQHLCNLGVVVELAEDIGVGLAEGIDELVEMGVAHMVLDSEEQGC